MRARLTPACHSAAHRAANSGRTRDFTNAPERGGAGACAGQGDGAPAPALPLLLTGRVQFSEASEAGLSPGCPRRRTGTSRRT